MPKQILGISAYYHDSAACLVSGGRIVAAAQEERFSRIKHDFSFPAQAVKYCLGYAGLSVDQLDCVAFYDKPFIKFERILETYLAFAPAGIRSFLQSMPLWLKQKLFLGETIRRELGYQGRIIFTQHHESHAASAFFPSPYEEAAILTVDGVGEWATATFGVGRGNEIELVKEIRFPHSLGLLYSAFTYFTGFKVNSGEYKLMGLAPYGEPVYVDLILRELIDLKQDGSFKLNLDYFDFCAGLRMTGKRFEKLFGGPARKPETPITRREMDMARSVQVVAEEAIMRMAVHVHETTGMKNLCLAGGVALNCVANGRILREGPFESIWIQPAAGDAGGALGAALFAHHRYLGAPRQADNRSDSQSGSYLGPAYSDREIGDYLEAEGIPHHRLDPAGIAGRVAGLIAGEKVIGLFQGRMEFGPRALGARSIIGDARSPEMQRVMNLKIKFRESFRPFAPTILREYVSEYFEMEADSPYMLLVADVRKDKRVAAGNPGTDGDRLQGLEKVNAVRSVVPAITHVDNSARVQTVDRRHHPLYYDIIKSFKELTGCPVIINTSFNVRGEPIVMSPEHAYRCFMRTKMDYLVMGSFLIDKTEQPPWPETDNWQESIVPD
ncbi:MAG: carbamoyltransferase [Candidatus Glassbacteria bacterium]|nr:carbamoyltransferase [Candidatus Glassbacteria bacterium]